MDERVGLERRQQAREDGAARIGLDDLRSPQVERRASEVDPGDIGDRRIAVEPRWSMSF